MKTQAIVLGTVPYADRQLIADLFTRESGRVSFLVKWSAGNKAKVKKQFFQPLSLLEIDYQHKPNKSLQRMSEVHILRPWLTINSDMHKIPLTFFSAEFLRHATKSEQFVQALFDFVVAACQWLDTSQRGWSNFHLIFAMRLSRFLGFFPNLEHYTPQSFFDLRAGAFTTYRPLHPDYLSVSESEALYQLMRFNFSTIHLLHLTRMQRNRIIDVILEFYRLHVPGFPSLKSLDILRALFD